MTAPVIRLDPMTEDEFAPFIVGAVRAYAKEQEITGRYDPEDSIRFSRGEYLFHVPEGLETENTFFYTIRDEESGERAGSLCLLLRRRARGMETYVFEIVIDEDKRRRGYGRATMIAVREWAKEHGTDSIGLHVFGHNAAARALYGSLGFGETDVMMVLPL